MKRTLQNRPSCPRARRRVLFVAWVLLAAACATEPDTQPGEPVSSDQVERVATSSQAGLESCEDVEMLTPGLMGALGARQNPDLAVMDVLNAYADEHADTFGGMWIDREYQALVLAFTDDPESHRRRIMALSPASEGQAGADPRPLGERREVTIDVVQVRYTEAELLAIQRQIMNEVKSPDLSGSLSSGPSTQQNRLSLDLYNPTAEALDELVQLVPDPSAVCVSVYFAPEPPTGPLEVIPNLDTEDPLVVCLGIPPAPYSRLVDPPSIDEVDHPAVEALRAELAVGGAEPIPQGPWAVIGIDEDLATFAVLFPDDFAYLSFERTGDRWLLSGMGTGNPCEPTVALPEGLNRVEIRLDPDSPPDPGSTSLDLLVTERECASGREMGEALQGPQVVETDRAVTVAFAAIRPDAMAVTCQGNPSTSVTIQLSKPLGDRVIYDGLFVPPKALNLDRVSE